MISHFLKKLHKHNLQKDLRMGPAWSVNKKRCCLISVGTEILLIWLLHVTLGFKEKNIYELVIFVCSEFHFFFFARSFLHVKATYILIYSYIILYFLLWNLPLKSQYKRTHLVPTTVSHWITGKYSWLNLKKPTIGGVLKSKPPHFHSSQS